MLAPHLQVESRLAVMTTFPLRQWTVDWQTGMEDYMGMKVAFL